MGFRTRDEFWSRMSFKRIRVTQAVEQDKADESDKKIDKADESVYTASQKELLRGTFNIRRSSSAFQKTRRYYEGLSPQQKEEFWSRVRSGNKADEESYKHQCQSDEERFGARVRLAASDWNRLLIKLIDASGIHWNKLKPRVNHVYKI